MVYKKIFVSIAGYTFCIIFYKGLNKRYISEFSKRVTTILQPLRVNASRPVNFTIEFYENIAPFTTKQRTIQNELYLQYAKWENTTTISSTYQISIPQFYVFFNTAVFSLIQKTDCFTIHTSAIAYKGKAFLFMGKSTAGKSTIISLVKDKNSTTLCDDTGFIRKIGCVYYFYPALFFEKKIIPVPNKRYLVEKIFLLKKNRAFNVTKIPTSGKSGENLLTFLIQQTKMGQQPSKEILRVFVKLHTNSFYFLAFKKRKFSLLMQRQIFK